MYMVENGTNYIVIRISRMTNFLLVTFIKHTMTNSIVILNILYQNSQSVAFVVFLIEFLINAIIIISPSLQRWSFYWLGLPQLFLVILIEQDFRKRGILVYHS